MLAVRQNPWDSGSLRSEEGCNSIATYVRNHLVLVQSWFRKSAIWGFWSLHRHIKNDRLFKNMRSQKALHMRATPTLTTSGSELRNLLISQKPPPGGKGSPKTSSLYRTTLKWDSCSPW